MGLSSFSSLGSEALSGPGRRSGAVSVATELGTQILNTKTPNPKHLKDVGWDVPPYTSSPWKGLSYPPYYNP